MFDSLYSYYLSTPAPNESFNRHLYEFDATTGEKCLTCDFTTPEGNKCTYASASFSTDLSYYAMSCSGPDPTFVKIYRNGLSDVLTWQENTPLRQRITEYALPQIEIFHVPVEGGFEAAVKMLVPPEVDLQNPEASEKYPLLVRVYGGPGSVRINSAFGVGYQVRKFYECKAWERRILKKFLEILKFSFQGINSKFCLNLNNIKGWKF